MNGNDVSLAFWSFVVFALVLVVLMPWSMTNLYDKYRGNEKAHTIRTSENITLVAGALSNEDSEIRGTAVERVGMLARPSRHPSLVPENYTADRDMLKKKTVEPLIDILKNDPDPYIRKDAAQSLGALRAKSATEDLIYALMNDDKVVDEAANALGQIGTRRALEGLREKLNKTEESQREGDVRSNIKAIEKRLGEKQ